MAISSPADSNTHKIDRLQLSKRSTDLSHTWGRANSWIAWLSTVDHKEIGLRFIITSFVFFLMAGILALLMRIQLSVPSNNFLGPDTYNQLFTTHGTAMMFLFAVPVMQGIGIYLVPLMIGTRAVAFPRLLNFSYYVYLSAGILLFTSLAFNMAPDVGWFSYVPLAGPEFSSGKRVDLWSQVITLVEASSLSSAVTLITTILKLRAPGMSLNRIPIFVWSQFVTAWMIVFAMPSVMLCSTMLATDRLADVGTQFFNQAEGGDSLLWQHLFWFFAHPEVYIIFIPATGFVTTIISTFSHRPEFGYTLLVLSLIGTAFIGFGVWVHHMFATPLPELGQGMFTASSLMITIPNGIQIFCWISTLWLGRIRLTVALGWILGFFAIFVLGGLTGVMLASLSLDQQVHDTFFVVAHLHYVLIGGALFPLFGAFYYWYPKWTGRLMSETLGWANLIFMFVGFNLAFFPMHSLGLHGMPRRIYTYGDETGWQSGNMLATCGAALLGIGVLLFIINACISRRYGELAGANPWNASTLEWTMASPPPVYNFINVPIVRSGHPTWLDPPDTPVIVGLRDEQRELLVTTTHDAIPHHRYRVASSSPLSVWTAFVTAGTAIGFIFHPIAFPIGLVVLLGSFVVWFWPSQATKPVPPIPNTETSTNEETTDPDKPKINVAALPGLDFDSQSPPWWGNTLFMVIETMSMVLLVASYFYVIKNYSEWPPPTRQSPTPQLHPWPNLSAGSSNVIILTLSAIPMIWADRAARQLKRRPVILGMSIATLAGLTCIALRIVEFYLLDSRWDENSYASIVWGLLFMQFLYLIVEVGEAGLNVLWVVMHGLDEKIANDVTLSTAYWYWTMAMGWLVYVTVYWSPRLLTVQSG